MDVSKLPKLSQTLAGPPPPATEPSPAAPPVGYYHPDDRPIVGAEAWISMAVGAILLLLNPTFVKFIFAAKPYRPFVDQTVNYTDSINFWSDLAITSFAFVLILEGIVLFFARNRVLLLMTFLLTAVTTLGNALYVVLTYGKYGLPIMSSLAAAFGVYIAMYQWRMLVSLRQPRA